MLRYVVLATPEFFERIECGKEVMGDRFAISCNVKCNKTTNQFGMSLCDEVGCEPPGTESRQPLYPTSYPGTHILLFDL